jgi:PilZ domain
MNDTGARTDSVTVLSPSQANVSTEKRREVRCAAELPLRLTSGSGELIPAVIHNLSANGLFATADTRFSLLLPPPNGARFEGEFFLDDIEARQLLLEVVRVAKQGHYAIGLGLQFIQPSPTLTTHIREKVASRLRERRRLP